jgi:hypothetical protein
MHRATERVKGFYAKTKKPACLNMSLGPVSKLRTVQVHILSRTVDLRSAKSDDATSGPKRTDDLCYCLGNIRRLFDRREGPPTKTALRIDGGNQRQAACEWLILNVCISLISYCGQSSPSVGSGAVNGGQSRATDTKTSTSPSKPLTVIGTKVR